MWGGRFADGPDAIMEAINVSIDFDQRLARQDIAGSRAHAQMLSDSGIITSDDLAEILNGLDQVEQELVNGTFPFRRDLEDIHMNVEARLKELIAAMGITPRDLLREKGTPYAELGLSDPALSDDQLLDAMLAHPILINRPIVETPKGTRLCRPSEAVLDLLDHPVAEFTKEDGEAVRGKGRRDA